MKKYYLITSASPLHKKYFEYLENCEKLWGLVKAMCEKFGIETTKYLETTSNFYITPTKNDTEKFSKILTKTDNFGFSRFKKNSDINKMWQAEIKRLGITSVLQPPIRDYINYKTGFFQTRFSWYYINVGDKLYATFETAEINEPTTGIEEIKASEYYRILEEHGHGEEG